MTRPAPGLRTLAQVAQGAADAYGEKTAVRDGAGALSYAELNRQRLRSAAAFLAAGLERGDRIAIWAPNMREWIIAAFGAQTLGITLVPINTRWKGAEAAYALNLSRAKLLFTVEEFLGQNYPAMLAEQDLPALQRTVVFNAPMAEGGGAPHAGPAKERDAWSGFLAAGQSIADDEVQSRAAQVTPDDILDIGFTSGTTGAPKGVVTTHGQNIRVFGTWSETVGLRSDDIYLVINPFFHAFGYKAGCLASMIRGAEILPALTFDLDQVLARIERDRVSMLPGAPAIYQSILAHPKRGDYDLSSLRLAVTGAAPVPVELVRRMRDELRFEVVVTAYGLTETCGTVTICRPDDPPEIISGTSGKAMAGVEVRIVNRDGAVLPPGEPGEIHVRGYNVMRGYLDNPAATAEAITPEGWLKTGDIGVLDKSGYLDITDRLKDMFITGGFNCYPAEIEKLLCAMPGVAAAAVIGMPDERLGEVACAFIVRDGRGGELAEESIIAWSRDNMANYKVPRAVHFLDALPVNASGKVLKTELRSKISP